MPPIDLASALARDLSARRLGVEPASGEGTAVRLDLTDAHTNFLGLTHGAVVYSLAELALRLASRREDATTCVVDTHLTLTGGSRPGDALTARAEELTRGRTLATYRVDVTRGDGRVVGLLTGVVRATAEPGPGSSA